MYDMEWWTRMMRPPPPEGPGRSRRMVAWWGNGGSLEFWSSFVSCIQAMRTDWECRREESSLWEFKMPLMLSWSIELILPVCGGFWVGEDGGVWKLSDEEDEDDDEEDDGEEGEEDVDGDEEDEKDDDGDEGDEEGRGGNVKEGRGGNWMGSGGKEGGEGIRGGGERIRGGAEGARESRGGGETGMEESGGGEFGRGGISSGGQHACTRRWGVPSNASGPRSSNECIDRRADVYCRGGGRQGKGRKDQGLDTAPIAEGGALGREQRWKEGSSEEKGRRIGC